MSASTLWRAIMSQPGRARLAGGSRWVSRQISRWCRLGLASTGAATPKAAPLIMNVRRRIIASAGINLNLGDYPLLGPVPPCSRHTGAVNYAKEVGASRVVMRKIACVLSTVLALTAPVAAGDLPDDSK